MEIRNIVHPGIRRLFLQDDPRGVPAGTVDRLRKMLAFLQDMDDIDELHAIPTWKAHQLAGASNADADVPRNYDQLESPPS